MGKKLKLPFLFNSKSNSVQAKSSWPWPPCHQPRTLSFRTNDKSLLETTINSASYLDAIVEAETPESWFTNSSESASFSTAASDESGGHDDPVETVIRGLRSERLFSEPGGTSSILEEATKLIIGSPFKDSVVLYVDSRDPYVDFRKSMEEMVEAHGLKHWEDLEELLCWYLRANGKSNHGYIIGAFVDFLVGLAANISATDNCIPSCSNGSQSHFPSSSSENNSLTTNLCSSSLSEAVQYEMIIIKDNKDDGASSSLLDV